MTKSATVVPEPTGLAPASKEPATLVSPNIFEGEVEPVDGRIGIVSARYNETITNRLLDGALATFQQHGIDESAIDVAWVPGAFEIPVVAQRLVDSGRYRAVICLGAVIRGETSHDRHINRTVSHGLGEISRQSGVPVLFGLLTCDTLEQAIHRSGGNVGNKGSECAEAALQMASLLERLPR